MGLSLLCGREGVNKKRVYQLMRESDLLVKPNLRLKAKRTDLHSGFKPGKVDPSPPLACDREIFRQAETDAPIGRAVVKLLISAEVQKAHSIAH